MHQVPYLIQQKKTKRKKKKKKRKLDMHDTHTFKLIIEVFRYTVACDFCRFIYKYNETDNKAHHHLHSEHVSFEYKRPIETKSLKGLRVLDFSMPILVSLLYLTFVMRVFLHVFLFNSVLLSVALFFRCACILFYYHQAEFFFKLNNLK